MGFQVRMILSYALNELSPTLNQTVFEFLMMEFLENF